MTNLAFGGHFGFPPSTHFSTCPIDGGYVDYDRRGYWTFQEKFSFLYFFSRLNFIGLPTFRPRAFRSRDVSLPKTAICS